MSKHLTLSEELAWRGFINQTTITDLKQLDEQKWVFYHGFDASADSQTIGNLAAMMLDRCFMRHGHKAILLAGGATSLIGDPGGKDKERPLQTEETVAKNVAKAEEELRRIFEGQEFKLVNNLEWFREMNLLWFLREIGKHFSMTPLVQRDYIANRMGEGGGGISFTELTYTLLQGYDYLHLHKEFGVNLQLAGSDQWGNSISGVDLIRKVAGKEVHALTLPLIINKVTGKKFGKTEEGAIWLDPNKTSVYKFYQFWLNVGDDSVEEYLKIYTELTKPQVDDTMRMFNFDRSSRSAQKKLAYEVTKLVHGKDAANDVFEISTIVVTDVELKKNDFTKIKDTLEVVPITLGAPLPVALVESGLAGSNTEARRLINAGAIYINNVRIDQTREKIFETDIHEGIVVLRRGKNKVAVGKVDK